LVNKEVKEPIPVPFDVFVVSEIVGDGDVDHTNPLELTAEPPSALIFPPDAAVVVVIELADIVITVGRTNDVLVLKVISFPYPVPALLVA
jgi:hypothetical protein